MVKKINRNLILIIIMLILFLVGIMPVIASISKSNTLSPLFDNPIISSSITDLDDDWYMKSDDNKDDITKCDFPEKFKYDEGKVFSFSRDLTGNFLADDNMLCVQTNISNLTVYVDNVKIYDYYDVNYDKHTNKALNKIHFIRLPNNFKDKNVTIKFRMCSGENLDYSIRKACVGSKTTIIYSMIKTEIPSLIFICASIILGLIVLTFSVTGILKKDEDLSVLFFVGLLTVVGCIYSFSTTNTIQIFIKNVYLINALKYISLLFIIVNFMVLIILNTPKEKCKFLYGFLVVTIINFVAQIILAQEQLIDFRSNLNITKCLIAALFIFTLFVQYKYWGRDKKFFLLSTLPLMFTSILEILVSTYSDLIRGGVVEFGLLIFIAMHFSHTISRYFQFVKKSMQADVFKELAYSDIMTEVPNRVSYEQKLTEVNDNRYNYLNIWCFSFDINNLKTVNDSLGHSSGDALIIGFASVLKQTFNGVGDYFRTGGDEFVAMIYNMKEEDIANLMDDFYKNLTEHNNNSELKLSVAVGFKKYNKETDKDITQTLLKADKLMYENKILIKKKNNMKMR